MPLRDPKNETTRRGNGPSPSGPPSPGHRSGQRLDERSRSGGARQRGLIEAMKDADPLPEADWMDPVLPAEPVEIG
jgi:hypothetical protein